MIMRTPMRTPTRTPIKKLFMLLAAVVFSTSLTFAQAHPEPAKAEPTKSEPAKADLTRAADKTRDAIGLLILAKAPPVASADKAEKPASAGKTAAVDKQHVLYAQRALLRLGYVVRADGAWNSATRRALEKFERDAGLPAKGQITPKLLQQLATLSGLARP